MNCNVRFVVLSGRSNSIWYCSWIVEVFSSLKMKEHRWKFSESTSTQRFKVGSISVASASHWKLWSAENAVRLTWSHRSPMSSLLESTEGKEVRGVIIGCNRGAKNRGRRIQTHLRMSELCSCPIFNLPLFYESLDEQSLPTLEQGPPLCMHRPP